MIKWTNEVVEWVYRAEAPTMPSGPGMPERRDWRRARFAVRAFRNLVRRIEKHADAIVAAVELGLSNSRLEGINAKIRLIQRRGFGYRNLDALTAAIYLCLGGVTLNLPTENSVVARTIYRPLPVPA